MSFLQPGPTCPLRHQASRRAASEDPSEFTLEARQILRQSLCGVEQASLCWPSVGWLLAEFLGSEWSPSAPWVREAVVHLIYVVSGFSAPDRSNSFPFWMHRIYLCFWFGFVCVCVCVCVYVESTMSLGQLKPEKLTKVSSIPRIFVEEAKGEAGRWQVTRPSGEGG